MNITTRPLLTDELIQLVLGTPTPWKEIFFLAAYTGLRVSDQLELPWQIDPPTWPIIEHKTGKKKYLAFTDMAIGYWRSLYNFGDPRRFLYPARDVSTYRKALKARCIALGIPEQRIAFHSFRKTHALITYRENGLLAAKSTMNHSSLAVTEKYIEAALRFDTGRAFDHVFADGSTPDVKR